MKALRALREGRNTNSAHKDAFNSLISDLRKKNPHWDRKSIDDHGSTTSHYISFIIKTIIGIRSCSCMHG
jgi:hypothetical protein